MFQLLDIAKDFLRQANIPENGTLADFTMGNGHDTLYLASLVPQGKVYAFDIQSEALENTRARLREAGISNATLILDSHANALQYIHAPIDAGMFNLGYRPGGDKSVHTMHESTLKAVTDAVTLLKPGGILVISVYPGHAEGHTEGDLLLEMLASYDKKLFCVTHFHLVNSPDAPFVIAVEKYDKPENAPNGTFAGQNEPKG